MSGVAEAAKNSGWVLAGRGVERLIRIAVVIVLARTLGARGFGVYSFAFAFAELFAIFTDAGLHTILVRETARDRGAAPALMGNVLILKTVMALLSWAAACAVAIWTIPAGETLWSALIASFLLFVSFRVTSLRTVFDAPFEADLKMAAPVLLGIGSEILSGVCLIAAARARWPIPALIGVQLAAFLPGCALLVRLSLRRVRPTLRFVPREWLRLLRLAVPIGAANVFLIVYTRIDLLMIEWLSSDVSVGMYSAAYKLTGSLAIVPSAITISLLPLLSAAFGEGDSEKMRRMYRGAVSLVVALGMPVVVCGLLLSGEIIGFVYGPGFAPAADALRVLAGATLISFVLYVMTTTGVAVGRTGLFTAYAALVTLLNVLLNRALIPSFDFVGASWATFIAEGLMLVAGLAVLKPIVGLPSLGAALRAAGAAVAAGAALLFIPAPLVVNLFISAVLYGTLIFWGKGLTDEGAAAISSLLFPKSRSRHAEGS